MTGTQQLRASTARVLIADAVLFFLCLAGVYHVSQKAGTGFDFEARTDSTVTPSKMVVVLPPLAPAQSPLSPGDRVLAVEGIPVGSSEEIEALLDRYAVGSTVRFGIIRGGRRMDIGVPLVRYYGNGYLMSMILTGSLLFFLAIFVLIKRQSADVAHVFHWLSVCAAVVIFTTWGRYTVSPAGLGYALRALFILSFATMGLLMLHFTLLFPVEKLPRLRRSMPWLYGIIAAVGVVTFAAFLRMAAAPDVETLSTYIALHQFRRVIVIVFMALGLGVLISSAVRAERADRRRTNLAIWGIGIGVGAFLLLWELPLLLETQPLIPEGPLLLIIAVAPLSFSIAILKFRLLDIDFFLKRGMVYSLVLLAMLGLYVLADWIIYVSVSDVTLAVLIEVSAVTFVLTYIVIEPARGLIQRTIDRRFFRVHYDFREAQRMFIHDIRGAVDIRSVADVVVGRIDALIPVTKVALFHFRSAGARLQMLAHRNLDILEGRSIPLNLVALRNDIRVPIARPFAIEPGLPHEIGDERMFHRWGLALIIAMLSEKEEITGFLVLGAKRSGARFSLEDVDLLTAVAAQTGVSIERLQLQESLIRQRLEAERLEEMSRMKSFFVSTVSHELKTPLTSIRMFSELLQTNPDMAPDEARRSLRIIEGEAGRLTRLINNVLDFAKIERGVKQYQMEPVDLTERVRSVLDVLGYQFEMRRFTIASDIPGEPMVVQADADAVDQALINLLSNAMKYSADRTVIRVRCWCEPGWACVAITDHGIGIQPEEQGSVFEAFYRARDRAVEKAPGTGLGLPLVRHIMDAHAGRVDLDSIPGEGSTFTLRFPST